MPKHPKSAPLRPLINYTVKLSGSLQSRVLQSMEAGGYSNWAEFCRVALMEKCHASEKGVRARDPMVFQRN